VFTKARHWAVFCAKRIQCSQPVPLSRTLRYFTPTYACAIQEVPQVFRLSFAVLTSRRHDTCLFCLSAIWSIKYTFRQMTTAFSFTFYKHSLNKNYVTFWKILQYRIAEFCSVVRWQWLVTRCLQHFYLRYVRIVGCKKLKPRKQGGV
jgi:hypothetical protein